MALGSRRGRAPWRPGRVCALTTLLIAAVLSASTLPADAGAATSVTLDRIWGADRYETSLAVTKRFVAEAGGRVDSAVVVPGTDWRDAVIASGLAGSLGAPVLLSPAAGPGARALDVLDNAGVSRIVVIDRARSLGASALEGLRRRFANVELLSGSDPSALSATAARRLDDLGRLPELGRTAMVASADVFVDAMVAGPVAWRGQHPILLTSRDTLGADITAALAQLDVEHAVIMGGPSAVSQTVVGELIAARISVTRIGGATRFDTAVALASFVEGAYASEPNAKCFDAAAAGVATARSPFDALSAAPLLGRRCSPLLLSDASTPDRATVSWVRDRTPSLTLFGGTAAISEAVAGVLRSDAPVYEAAATGAEHTCAVAVGGRIVCWGDDSSDQLDAPAGAFAVIAAGGRHSCALDARGRAVCWGDDSSDQLDAPDRAFTAIAAGGVQPQGATAMGFSCALRRAGGAVDCWGDDSYGQVRHAPAGRFSAVAAGWGHACALRAPSGEVVCWGFDGRGQVSKAPPGRFSAVAAGAWHACALRVPDGAAVCWGESAAAQAVAGSYTHVAAGADVTCALQRSDGEVVCWGFDGLDQISDAPTGAYRSVVASAWHMCAVRVSGEIVCWGDNSEGQSAVPLVLGPPTA